MFDLKIALEVYRLDFDNETPVDWTVSWGDKKWDYWKNEIGEILIENEFDREDKARETAPVN